MSKNIKIVGICRFSMIGRGDWKAYRNLDEKDIEKIYTEKERELFSEDRINLRLETFDKITLSSLKSQTDQNFVFIVVSSDRMPETYRSKLEKLCNTCQNIVLRFVPPMHIVDAQKEILAELNIKQDDCLQFRLDDDDAVSSLFIERLRFHANSLWDSCPIFAISFPNLIYSVIGGETHGVYRWFDPFLGVGLAVRNPKRSVYGYAHYKMPQSIIGLTDPSIYSLVTHHGMNDTPRHKKEKLKKRGMIKPSIEDLNKIIRNNFDFLSEEGKSLAGLIG